MMVIQLILLLALVITSLNQELLLTFALSCIKQKVNASSDIQI